MHAAPAARNQALPSVAAPSCSSSAADRRVDCVAARRPTYGFGNRHFGAFEGPTGGPPAPAPPAATGPRTRARRTRARPRARHRAGWGGDVAEVTDLAAPDTTDASERRALRLQAMQHAPPRTTDDVQQTTCNTQRAPRNMQHAACTAQHATRRVQRIAQRYVAWRSHATRVASLAADGSRCDTPPTLLPGPLAS
jgi:hypothetical protein